MTHGTWQTTGGGGSGGPPAELIKLAVVVGATVGAGLAVYAFVMAILPLIFIAVLALAVMSVAGRTAFVFYRHRYPEAVARLEAQVIPPPKVYILGQEPEAKALPASRPQVVNNYFGGQHYHGDADSVPVVRGELVPREDEEW